MTNLHKIRARIRSVNSTQQITRTMKMIAVSKLRKTQTSLAGVRLFADIHEPLDEGGLPGAHGAHHADVDIPSGAGGDILIDTGIHSIPSFFRSIVLFHSMSGCCEV